MSDHVVVVRQPPERVLVSTPGMQGPPGETGASAYEVALATGFAGTEEEWLASLEGQQGVAGPSAYEVAVAEGFVGSEPEWLASLQADVEEHEGKNDPHPGYATDDDLADAIQGERGLREAADALLIPLAQKGAPGGVPELDADGRVLPAQLPPQRVGDTFPVASEAAMLALAADAGDLAVRSDVHRNFRLTGDDPTVLAAWVELESPPDAVTSVNGQVGGVVLPVDGAPATASLRTLGGGAQQAAPGDHPGLTGARTPTPHAGSHATGGADPLTPAAIGAAVDAAVVHLAGAEAVAGVKTFGAAPVVPDGSFSTAKVVGLVARLDVTPAAVVHGANAATARPAAAKVYWTGSVAPANAAANDEWTDTANNLIRRYTGAVWQILGGAAIEPALSEVGFSLLIPSAFGYVDIPGMSRTFDTLDGRGVVLEYTLPTLSIATPAGSGIVRAWEEGPRAPVYIALRRSDNATRGLWSETMTNGGADGTTQSPKVRGYIPGGVGSFTYRVSITSSIAGITAVGTAGAGYPMMLTAQRGS